MRRGCDFRAALLYALDNAGGCYRYIALVARLEGITRRGIRRCADDIPVLRQIQRVPHADLQRRSRKRDALRLEPHIHDAVHISRTVAGAHAHGRLPDRLRRNCAGGLVDRDRIAGNNLVCEVARRTCRIHADYLRARLIHADDHALLLNRDLLRLRQHRQRRLGLFAVLRRNVDLRAAHLQRRNRALLVDGRNFRIRHGIAAQAVRAARGREFHCRPRAHANAQLIIALCEGNAGRLLVDLHGQYSRLAVMRCGRDLRAALLYALDNAGGCYGYITLVARLEGITRRGIRWCADDISVL